LTTTSRPSTTTTTAARRRIIRQELKGAGLTGLTMTLNRCLDGKGLCQIACQTGLIG
jgi:hypothetical protein